MDTNSNSLKKYISPKIQYFKTRKEFDIAVGEDFIHAANKGTSKGDKFLVGLAHGQSPSGAYQYILNHYDLLKKPELIRYTFVNSPLKRQRDLVDVFDAKSFLHELQSQNLLDKENILGSAIHEPDIEKYAKLSINDWENL